MAALVKFYAFQNSFGVLKYVDTEGSAVPTARPRRFHNLIGCSGRPSS
jgi:hypothetical protein